MALVLLAHDFQLLYIIASSADSMLNVKLKRIRVAGVEVEVKAVLQKELAVLVLLVIGSHFQNEV